MREKPLIFSGPMVQAILENRKSMTRRLDGLEDINERPNAWNYRGTNIGGEHLFFDCDAAAAGHEPPDCVKIVPASCLVGYHIWVRETWRMHPRGDGYVQYREDNTTWVLSLATQRMVPVPEIGGYEMPKWRPSIFMPRKAARIILEITAEERCERVQDISIEDAKGEGIPEYGHEFRGGMTERELDEWRNRSTVENFAWLWDSINAKRGYPWSSNPWVRRIEFTRVQEGK